MTTTVVNLHKVNKVRPPFDIYCGRKTPWTEFTEDSVWANHYTKEEWGEEALVMYETQIREKIAKDPVKYNLESLRNRILACWCVEKPISYIRQPMKCHVEVLLKLLNERRPI